MTNFSYPVIDMVKTGIKIRQLIRDKTYTVEKVRDCLELETSQALYKWFRGESVPKVDNLIALCRLLDVKVEDMIICKDANVDEIDL